MGSYLLTVIDRYGSEIAVGGSEGSIKDARVKAMRKLPPNGGFNEVRINNWFGEREYLESVYVNIDGDILVKRKQKGGRYRFYYVFRDGSLGEYIGTAYD